MLEKLIAASIRHRVTVLVLALVLVAGGVRAFQLLPIDAVPDLTNVQVQVLTSCPSLGPLDVERLVTAPVEFAMSGLPRMREVRSISRYGVSAVTVVFEDDVDAYFARQLVNERLPRARDAVPSGYGTPELGPMSTGLGEIYQFEVRGTGHSLMELRSILDWQIAPQLRMVPGVIEVNSFGGEMRTYEVSVDPRRLIANDVSLQDLFTALETNNRSAGGGTIIRGAEALLVRGEGLVQTLEDIRNIVVATRRGVPVYVRQLGDVRFAAMLRQGAATRDARGEVVGGMAMMLIGENSRVVSRAVDEAAMRINRTLPAGVRIEVFYDRTTLVNKTIRTVAKNLIEGGLLVIVVLFLMLRNLRAGIIAASMIPLCMLIAFIGMKSAGISGNLMSLGAIDFGLVVDGAIIMLENAVHHLSEEYRSLGRPLQRRERDAVVLRSALEMSSATAFGLVIIALVYLPILALQGVEGKTFRPMALTVLFALGGAFVLSLTFVPALASLVLPPDAQDKPSPIVTAARWLYSPALRATIRRPLITVCVALVLLVASGYLGTKLGSEFVPQLDEGALVIEVIRLPSSSLEESVRHSTVIERVLRRFREVSTVVCKTGRPEIANDPMGVDQTDVFVMLHPGLHDREALVIRMSAALRAELPGIVFGFSQPIQMRMNELISGVRADVAIKLYGEDLPTLARWGARIARTLSRIHGAADVRVDRVQGLPVLRALVDREAVARRGANVDDVLAAIESIGGHTTGIVLEGRRRYAMRVRLAPELRGDLDAIRMLPVRVSGETFAPLSDLAHLEIVDEPVLINREATERRLIVQVNVRGRDLGGFADEAQRAVAREIHLPSGYRMEWGGQFENLRRASERLLIVVPLALALILTLLYLSFRSIPPALLIFVNVPFAAIGGLIALYARRMPFSISAGVGFIALFGVAVLNGLVLVTQIRRLRDDGLGANDAAREGALRRLRPVLTTALVASLGFLPMAFAKGEGAEVQRPLATVVIGGLITSTLLTLLVLPAVYAWIARWRDRRARPDARSTPPPPST